MLKRPLFPIKPHAGARAIALSLAAGCVANVPLTAFAQAAGSAATAAAATGTGANSPMTVAWALPARISRRSTRPWQQYRPLRPQILTVNRFITTGCWACSAPDL